MGSPPLFPSGSPDGGRGEGLALEGRERPMLRPHFKRSARAAAVCGALAALSAAGAYLTAQGRHGFATAGPGDPDGARRLLSDRGEGGDDDPGGDGGRRGLRGKDPYPASQEPRSVGGGFLGIGIEGFDELYDSPRDPLLPWMPLDDGDGADLTPEERLRRRRRDQMREREERVRLEMEEMRKRLGEELEGTAGEGE